MINPSSLGIRGQSKHLTGPLGRFTLRALMIDELQHLQYLMSTGPILAAANVVDGKNLAEAIGYIDDGSGFPLFIDCSSTAP
jgi:hypothetical protein